MHLDTKDVCLEINQKKKYTTSAKLYCFHCLLFTFTFTVQFKNVPDLNIPRALFTISNVSETVLPLTSVTLLYVQGPSRFNTLALCSKLGFS